MVVVGCIDGDGRGGVWLLLLLSSRYLHRNKKFFKKEKERKTQTNRRMKWHTAVLYSKATTLD